MATPPLSPISGHPQVSLPWPPNNHPKHTTKNTKNKNHPRTRTRSLLAASCRILDAATNPTNAKKPPDLIHQKQDSDANAQIRRSCQLGDLTQALRLLGSESVVLESYCAVLQLCAEVKSLEGGKRAHLLISSSGVGIDGVLGSKLVFMYVKCGELREARRVFDEMALKSNVYVWNLLMSGYAKAGDFQESILLFKQMHGSGIMPDARTISCILKCATSLRGIAYGEMVHGYLVKLDFRAQCAVGNALVAFYSKSRRIEDALQVFDGMPHRDVISWNSMISGCASNGLHARAVELFVRMWVEGEEIDSATMVSVLPACAELGYQFVGRTLHGYSVKAGLIGEICLANSLLVMYSKCSDLRSAIQMFKKTDRKNVVSWTAMITTYTQAALFDKAIKLFQKMELESIRPDVFAVTSALHACAGKGSLEHGKYVHDYAIRNGMEKNVSVANALMEMYTKCGDMEQARSVFDRTVNKDIISWNTLVGGYSRNNFPNEAFSLFSEMQLNFRPNSVTMACILPAAASLSSLERGREMHAYAIRRGYLEDGYVANALVDMYVKCGALLLARRLFDRMMRKNLISWTIMIAGYGMHGHGGDAIAVFEEMRGNGIEPDEASFTAIQYACGHSGLTDEGWRFFDTMRNEYKIQPRLKHYACMVDLLSRAGHLRRAYKFIESMPVVPDSSIWGALLRGCRFHRDVKLAEKVAERVFELEPENTGHYIHLADIYAEAEKWEAVKKLQRKIGGGRGLRDNPGSSWIEIRSKVHVFVTADRKHPQGKKIAEFLDEVARKMKDEGHDSKKKYALMDAADDDAVKEEALCGHSEKLAIAFGVLNSPEGRPIRVAKNSRVCGDCHEVAKFISKMCSREIILRDSNRFHHLEEGRCCCRGYW